MDWNQLTGQILDACKVTFGELCIHKPAGSTDTESFTGVFNTQTAQANAITGQTVMTQKPRLLIKLSDLSQEPAQGDRITVRGFEYKITDIVRDGQGGAEISLHKIYE